jgi:ubiquinone/menaquinone biosynthesis C-methylase UbiE
VLDLGSGGGFDCFLAAMQVGETGRVIGVDMTPEMIRLARKSAAEMKTGNIEFRLGEMEHLPVADSSVDVIISNCAINLSLEKHNVFKEAHRVLKPGGRLAISDIVSLKPLPPEYKRNLLMIAGCVAGAESVKNIRQMLLEAGFDQIDIEIIEQSREVIQKWAPGKGLEMYVRSANIRALKP